jgi:hypothetical protein
MKAVQLPYSVIRGVVAGAMLAITACSSDDVTAPLPPVEGTMTVDAATAWAYVDLDAGATVTPTPSAAESEAWDIAFNVTNVMLNGGEAGPGGVVGYCICQNAGATNEQVLAMTADSELADFEGVTDVPAGATWSEDVLTPAFSGWYTGSGASAVADPSRTFFVRLSGGSAYAKLHVTDLEAPTATTPGTITFEYAIQPTSVDAFGPTLTHVTTVSENGTTLIDLDPQEGVPIGTGWDFKLEGWSISLNGGPSGPGAVGVITSGTPYDEVTTAYIEGVNYQTDRYTGVFGASRWYRYNLEGDNRISPTFEVYLLKRGDSVYKIQLLDYYGDTGDPRQITFRYERIAP